MNAEMLSLFSKRTLGKAISSIWLVWNCRHFLTNRETGGRHHC